MVKVENEIDEETLSLKSKRPPSASTSKKSFQIRNLRLGMNKDLETRSKFETTSIVEKKDN